jgi:hypothetical protein
MWVGKTFQHYLRYGAAVRVDTFKDFTQSAQRKSGGKSEEDNGIYRRDAEKTEEYTQECLIQ